MSGWPPSWVCFYCTNPINKAGHFVEAILRTHYARGGSRDATRRFHEPCFEKFETFGRPWNPTTNFELLTATVFFSDEPLKTLDADETPSAAPSDAPHQAGHATDAQR